MIANMTISEFSARVSELSRKVAEISRPKGDWTGHKSEEPIRAELRNLKEEQEDLENDLRGAVRTLRPALKLTQALGDFLKADINEAELALYYENIGCHEKRQFPLR